MPATDPWAQRTVDDACSSFPVIFEIAGHVVVGGFIRVMTVPSVVYHYGLNWFVKCEVRETWLSMSGHSGGYPLI